ncbi:MAG TPA: iron-containing redox enzyme family protein [Verrucomicrobiae bacterium]|nr:iron-containing redox enzyme family protein [Verrucomicrobiae bacterium]
MLARELLNTLKEDALRKKLITHPFFTKIGQADLNRGQVGTFLGQWWHPLHYFPVFLSRLISVTPPIGVKTAIGKILYQELGEGDPRRAHEVVYIETMTPLGFAVSEISAAAPLPATARLVAAYSEASKDLLAGLGFLYGTEVADLAMVSGIGTAVRRVTGAKRLDWVDIHVQQEPEHVVRANDTLTFELPDVEKMAVLSGAQAMWQSWIAFFDELEREVFAPQGAKVVS